MLWVFTVNSSYSSLKLKIKTCFIIYRLSAIVSPKLPSATLARTPKPSVFIKPLNSHSHPGWHFHATIVSVALLSWSTWLLCCFRPPWPTVDPSPLQIPAKPNWGGSASRVSVYPQLYWCHFSPLVYFCFPAAVSRQAGGPLNYQQVRPQTHWNVPLWVHEPELWAPEHLDPPVCHR